jgi:hypothetical protein
MDGSAQVSRESDILDRACCTRFGVCQLAREGHNVTGSVL